MKRELGACVVTVAIAGCVHAGERTTAADKPWSVRMADSEMTRTPDPLLLDVVDKPKWEYTQGLVLKAMLEVWRRSGDERYWDYARAYYDGMLNADGTIKTYVLQEYFVPVERFDEFVPRIRTVLRNRHVNVLNAMSDDVNDVTEL